VARFAAPILAAVLIAVLAAGYAAATRTQVGHVVVSLDASFSPRRVPRQRLAPVSISFAGSLATDDRSPLPRLRGLELALASGSSRLDTRGLHVCPRRLLRGSTIRHGRALCRRAIVGQGSLSSEVYLPGQSPFSAQASVLAFNGGGRGPRAAVWLLAYSPSPPVSFVLPVFIRHRSGPLATTLTGQVPRSLGPWPHLSAFQLTFARRFAYRGSLHSYLSASCPVPPRFTGGLLPFARARYFFNGGLSVTTSVNRSCHVSD
jgi:hypothetical protein